MHEFLAVNIHPDRNTSTAMVVGNRLFSSSKGLYTFSGHRRKIAL